MPGVGRGFIVAIFVVSCFLYSTQLLDYYLHSRFVVASALTLWALVLVVKQKQFQSKFDGISVQGIILSLFILFNFLSITWAHEKTEALFAAQKWLLAGAAYWVLTSNFSRSGGKDSQFVSRISLASTFVVLCIVSFHVVKIGAISGFSNEALYQIQVLFGHKSLISAFLFLLMPLNLFSTKHSRAFIIYGIVIWQIVVILLLQSRTVYLSLLLFLVILVPYLYSRWKHQGQFNLKHLWVPISVVLIGSVLLSQVPNLKDRLDPRTYFKSQTATERQLVWLKTKPLIADHWILGVGSGNWKIEFPKNSVEGSYRMQDQNVFFTRAHNDFLEVLAELGLPGLLMYVLLFVNALRLLYRERARHSWQIRMLMGGLGGFIVISLIDFPKERIEFLLMLALYLSLAQAYGRTERITIPFVWAKLLFIAAAGGLVMNLITGYSRYVGESNTKKLLKARTSEQWTQVIELAKKAENKWHHLDPSSVPISFYQGVASYNLGAKEEAKVSFTRAHHIAPYNFHVINNLATIEIDMGNYQAAIDWLDEALRINSRFEDALFNLAYCHTQLGNFTEALETVRRIPSESEKKELFKQEIESRMNAK